MACYVRLITRFPNRSGVSFGVKYPYGNVLTSLHCFGAASCRMFKESTDRVFRAAFSGRFFMLKGDASEFFDEGSFRRFGICPRYFELPACLHRNMLTIIITPVIALMRDQKQRWPDDVRVQCLYHGNPENSLTYTLLKKKKLSVLYLSPKRLADPKICKALRENLIIMVVVDEVHCLMEWGNEFRPMYQ